MDLNEFLFLLRGLEWTLALTAIGQSQTLADFMLKAKEWILGQGSETDRKATDGAAIN